MSTPRWPQDGPKTAQEDGPKLSVAIASGIELCETLSPSEAPKESTRKGMYIEATALTDAWRNVQQMFTAICANQGSGFERSAWHRIVFIEISDFGIVLQCVPSIAEGLIYGGCHVPFTC